MSATARTLSLRRLRDSARGLSKQAALLARRPARPDRVRTQVARRGAIYPAHARSIPVFHLDIRLYAIGSTTDVVPTVGRT